MPKDQVMSLNMFNRIVIGLVASYIFICTIPYTPAARYILLGTLLATSAVGLYQKRFSCPPKSSVLLSFSLFVGIAFISAVLSPYPLDSLQGFRREYLPPLLVLLIASGLKQTPEAQLRAATVCIWALLSGFAIKTALALWDGGFNHPFIFSPYSNPEFFEKNGLPRYVSYYAVESVLYLTLAYSALLYLDTKRTAQWLLIFTCGISLGILLASGIRSAFAASMLGLLIITLAALRSSNLMHKSKILIVIGIASIFYLGNNTNEISRYIELIKAERYSKKDGMSGRYFIWEGVSELISTRPALGFGPGWQKIPLAAKDTGLVSQWQSETSTYAQLKQWYFSLEQGKANPHNLVLQVLFETGWFGLIAYLSMISTLFWGAFTASKANGSRLAEWLKVVIVGYGAALFIIDITNAFLLHNTMVALMLITILTRQSANEKLQPSQQ